MQRKLIQLSPSTAVVSLPSSWIKANALKKGAELVLEEVENKIIISLKSVKNGKEITIDISNLPDKLMWVSIHAAYVQGYDSIILVTRDSEQTFFMNKVVQYFPGMIIYEEHKNSVHFKDIGEEANGEKFDLNKLLNRIFHLIATLFDDALQAAKTKDWSLLANIKKRDYVINSYIAYYFRHMNKSRYNPFSKIGTMHSYVKILEMFADQICILFKVIGKQKLQVKNELSILTELLNLYRKLQSLHFGFTQEKFVAFENSRLVLNDSVVSLQEHTQLYAAELLELLFDLEELDVELNI